MCWSVGLKYGVQLEAGSWKVDGKIDVSVTSFCEIGKCAALLRFSR
jgi:hypothetical protein